MGEFSFGGECLRKWDEEGSTDKNIHNYTMLTVFLPCFVITKWKGKTMISKYIKRKQCPYFPFLLVFRSTLYWSLQTPVSLPIHSARYMWSFLPAPQDGVQLHVSTARHEQQFLNGTSVERKVKLWKRGLIFVRLCVKWRKPHRTPKRVLFELLRLCWLLLDWVKVTATLELLSRSFCRAL